MSAENIIEVSNLSAGYNGRLVLSRLNVAVRQGEIFVIMGGSGSGKSTLLRTMLGLHPISQGSIKIFGRELAQLSSKELFELRRNVGVAFQHGALLGSLSLRQNIELPLREHTKLDDNTIRIMSRMKLDMMNLSGFDDLMPSELSGGMLKRAALARAVIMDPKLLFFDEPSAGLDPVVAAELDEYILQLKSAMNMTIVVVTHELHSAFKIADRVAILADGEMMVVGSKEEVQNCDNQRVQDFLNRRPRRDQTPPEDYLQQLTAQEEL